MKLTVVLAVLISIAGFACSSSEISIDATVTHQAEPTVEVKATVAPSSRGTGSASRRGLVKPTTGPTTHPPTLIPTVVPKVAIVVTAETLISVYKSNPLAGDAKYKGKVAIITGTISSIAESGNYIDVKFGNADIPFEPEVVCKVSDPQTVLLLRKGHIIDVTGTVVGVTGIQDIVVDNCVIPDGIRMAENAYQRGIQFVEENNWEKAKQEFDKAIKFNPDFVEAYVTRGDVGPSLRGYYCDIKEEAVWKSFDVDGDRFDLSASKSIALDSDCADLLTDYDVAIELDPDNSRAYFGRGVRNFQTGDTSDSFSDLTNAIELDPEFLDAYFMRGQIHLRLFEFQQAYDDFDRMLSIDLENVAALHQRSKTAYTLHKLKQGDLSQLLETANRDKTAACIFQSQLDDQATDDSWQFDVMVFGGWRLRSDGLSRECERIIEANPDRDPNFIYWGGQPYWLTYTPYWDPVRGTLCLSWDREKECH